LAVWDTSQLPAGAFYDPNATARAKYGSYRITGIQLVVDKGGTLDMTVRFDNTQINSALYTYEKQNGDNGGDDVGHHEQGGDGDR
jgi:major membrane immunogen (membrane-anchored lipoprotein)